MRPFIFLIVCLSYFSSSWAQKPQNVSFLKFNGQEVKIKDSADFIRIIQEPDSGSSNFKVFEYYPDSTRRFIGAVSTFVPSLIYEGPAIHFYKNGRKEKQLNYRNGVPDGTAYHFYPNGRVQKELFYGTEGMKVIQGYGKFYHYKLLTFYDSSGVQLVNQGSGRIIENDRRFIQEGNFLNGVREGVWKFTEMKTSSISEEVYTAGEFISGKVNKPDGSFSTYQSLEALPEFKGGTKSFYSYLGNNIQYPPDAKMARIDGTVYISLVVEPDGNVTDVKIIRSVHPSLDQEALRVIRRSPKWKPGHQHGVPVRVAYTVPVAYKLRPQ